MSDKDAIASPRIPRVGDIVLYCALPLSSSKYVDCAAIITDVKFPDDPRSDVALIIFLAGHAGTSVNYAAFSEQSSPMCWSWRPE